MNIKTLPLNTLASISLFSAPLLADEILEHHSTKIENDRVIEVEGGFTATLQSSSDSRIKDEALTSFDLVTTYPSNQGKWTAYIEGNTNPRQNGISSLLGEVNGDAGSSVDRDGKGRLQVSELHYSHPIGETNMTVGLINPASVLDSSEIANDETSQFLSSNFVNNPTIAFPDYVLGASLQHEEGKFPGVNLLLTSSHGLGDNPNRSYSELVNISASSKGFFIGGELYWTYPDSNWRMGMWANSAKQVTLGNPANTEKNYGAYLTTDHKLGNTQLNLRAGIANEDVSESAGFIALALEMPVASHTLGAGLSKTVVSNNLGSNRDDTNQAEVYVRFDLDSNIHITPSVQYIENSGFDNTATNFDKNITVYSVRAGYSF